MSKAALNYRNIEIRAKNDFVTISFDCDFGPISFSFNLEKLSARLSTTVSEMLDRIHKADPEVLSAISKNTDLSIEEVKKILESHILKGQRTVQWSAIEKFMQGRNLTLEGSIQQVIEGLPASIMLMLIYLTEATLIRATELNKVRNFETFLVDHELCQSIYTSFKNSINGLWEQAYKNTD